MQRDGSPAEDPDEIELIERQLPFISDLLSVYDDMRKSFTTPT
jgi:hypothetical protein